MNFTVRGGSFVLLSLLVFEEDETAIEFRYSNEAGENVTKTFEILSDSVIADETAREYQWFGAEAA